MALTITPIRLSKDSGARINVLSVTFDSSYATGGESITANDVGLVTIDALIPLIPSGGRVPVWDSTAAKLKAMVTGSSNLAVLGESTAGTDLSTVTTIVLAVGV